MSEERTVYTAYLYNEWVDDDQDSTDLLRRMTQVYGIDVVMGKDFRIEKEEEVQSR